jgi:hypothetical protein
MISGREKTIIRTVGLTAALNYDSSSGKLNTAFTRELSPLNNSYTLIFNCKIKKKNPGIFQALIFSLEPIHDFLFVY